MQDGNDNKVESNRYKCIRLLGEGSFGKAFLVECPDKVLFDLSSDNGSC